MYCINTASTCLICPRGAVSHVFFAPVSETHPRQASSELVSASASASASASESASEDAAEVASVSTTACAAVVIARAHRTRRGHTYRGRTRHDRRIHRRIHRRAAAIADTLPHRRHAGPSRGSSCAFAWPGTPAGCAPQTSRRRAFRCKCGPLARLQTRRTQTPSGGACGSPGACSSRALHRTCRTPSARALRGLRA